MNSHIGNHRQPLTCNKCHRDVVTILQWPWMWRWCISKDYLQFGHFRKALSWILILETVGQLSHCKNIWVPLHMELLLTVGKAVAEAKHSAMAKIFMLSVLQEKRDRNVKTLVSSGLFIGLVPTDNCITCPQNLGCLWHRCHSAVIRNVCWQLGIRTQCIQVFTCTTVPTHTYTADAVLAARYVTH